MPRVVSCPYDVSPALIEPGQKTLAWPPVEHGYSGVKTDDSQAAKQGQGYPASGRTGVLV